jgi:hypothetical protein
MADVIDRTDDLQPGDGDWVSGVTIGPVSLDTLNVPVLACWLSPIGPILFLKIFRSGLLAVAGEEAARWRANG